MKFSIHIPDVKRAKQMEQNGCKKITVNAQTGLGYSRDNFDIERFEQIRELSIELMSEYTDIDNSKIRSLFANENGYQTPKWT